MASTLLAALVALLSPPGAATPASGPVVAPTVAGPADAEILRALCPAGERCTVVTRLDLGPDGQGRARWLAAVDVVSKTFESALDLPGGPCHPQPHALLRVANGTVAVVEPLLVVHGESECSYGASGGEEEVVFRDGRLSYSITGGSAWGWAESRTWALEPALTLIETTSSAYWKLGPNTHDSARDVLSGTTRVRWAVPACSGYGAEDPMKSGVVERTYTVIPRLDPPEAEALEKTWRTAALPGVALTVDSAGLRGHVVYGAPGAPADARLRVVATGERTLIVEVADDTVVAGGKTWIMDDHLELWAGDASLSYEATCVEPRGRAALPEGGVGGAHAWQWGVRLTDARVTRGGGKPKVDPTLERVALTTADWGPVVRFRVVFPPGTTTFSVIYSDSDDAKSQKRLIGTSQLNLKDPYTLGVIAPR